jgi:dihydroxyacetone kinase-like protein
MVFSPAADLPRDSIASTPALKASAKTSVSTSLPLAFLMESTKDMLAIKGRASFLEERSIGHIDAGARSSQLMICAMVDVLQQEG